MTQELHCPYCNALVPPPPGVRPGQPITCPRCEETFRALASAPAADPGAPATSSPAAPPASGPPRSNSSVAFVVLSVMGLTALVALTFALLTVGVRRGHDTGLARRNNPKRQQFPEAKPPPEAPPVAPLELEGLRYLHHDVEVVVAAHIARLPRDGSWRKALQQAAPALANLEGRVRRRVEQLTGLGWHDLDHVVLGARLEGQLFPPIQVVVRTRRPYDRGAVRSRLKGDDRPVSRGQPVYSFRQELLPTHSEGLVSFPDDQTLVLGWLVRPSQMPVEPRKDAGHLPGEITAVLKDRITPPGPVWAVGHSKDWSKLLALRALLRPDAQARKALGQLRTFAVWLLPAAEEKAGATLFAAVRGADPAAAEALEQYLRERFQDLKGLTIIRAEEWLTLQYRPERGASAP